MQRMTNVPLALSFESSFGLHCTAQNVQNKTLCF